MRTIALAIVVSAITATAADCSLAADVSFRTDVMPVLSKAGCNLGTCHGNQNGKGGFKLSLRGQDPDLDFATLTRELDGRRANIVEPDRSLLLLKPTMQVPHEGGRRFDTDSVEFQILRMWVAAGMPADGDESPRLVRLDVSPLERVLVEPAGEVELRAEATFSDGSRRDVSRLAVYEPDQPIVAISPAGRVQREKFGEVTITARYLDRQSPVRLAFIPARPDFVWTAPAPANVVDEHVFGKLKALQINPSPTADDTVFLRRAFLDLTGLLPTAAEAQAFVADGRPDKRARLIDDLLDRPEFADFWALKWSDLLRNEEKTLDRKGVQHFHHWIRSSIAENKPVDQFVREIVAARGSTYANPPANYYRAMRDPLMRAESTAQLFLGIRLQCAKCHNHPFDRWTQDDYYGWANLFARVDYKILENRRRDDNDKHEFDGEQIVYLKSRGAVDNPQTGEPEPPRFLSDAAQPLPREADRLDELALWLTAPENTRFAQTQVNRIWYHLLGRGIVDPIDDFRATNPPSNPALLEALTQEFVSGGYDLRQLIRTIMNSHVYQLSSEPTDGNRDDASNFSHAAVRRLSAEQLLDALSQVAGMPVEFNGYPAGMRAGQLPGGQALRSRRSRPSEADQFLRLFGKPQRLQTCECERSDETTLAQVFQLISGELLGELLSADQSRIATLTGSSRTPAEIVEDLYWTALTRPPTDEERAATLRLIESSPDRRRAVEDIAWALVTSAEFMLRR